MKICRRCVLPESFPGIVFNAEGVCQYCLNFKGGRDLEIKKKKYRAKFEALVGRCRNSSRHDAIVSYSGGKDSTYVLSLISRDYGLKALAVTFDNGFIPEQALMNIRAVVDELGIEHLFIRPPFRLLRRLFVACSEKPLFPPTTLTRASTVCTACMALVKFSTLRLAVERKIPFLVFGWSPGQIPLASSIVKNTSAMSRLRQQALVRPIVDLAGDEIKRFFLEESHFESADDFPYSISPLAFLDYDENEIREEIGRLGWKAPAEVDPNSTNCLLNSFANMVHMEKHGFHPYAFELAKLVREGYLERPLALAKLNEAEKPETVLRVKRKLGLRTG
jgi:tRNA(Ile)-lysidine synthase TilS/MesJ